MSDSEKTSSNLNLTSLNLDDERLIDPDAGKSETERANEVCSYVLTLALSELTLEIRSANYFGSST